MQRHKLPRSSRPSLYTVALFGCAGMYAYNSQGAAPAILFPLAVMLISLAFVGLWDWGAYKVLTYRQMIERPYIPGDDVRMLEAIARMDDNQLTAAFAAMGYEYEPPPELVPEEIDPEIAVGITKSYAISETDRAVRNRGYLSPLRDTSEGTPERNRRKAFEVWLDQQGLIEPAAGPKPARIKDYHETRERITNGR